MNNKNRIVISIGCDDYHFLAPLRGAVLDAKNMFSALTSKQHGNYNEDTSILLESPTRDELSTGITNTLIAHAPFDTVTIFFAGHGGVYKGSYYLFTKDSRPGVFSTTAMPLSLLFTIVNEISPAQCNIIIDACQAGGLTIDVGTLLKPELMGGAHTSGVSIFASAAADEYAGDTSAGGTGTNALLQCIEGKALIQTQRPYLDLVEVGRAAAQLLKNTGVNQTPVVWGLNLFGQSVFTQNPHFNGPTTSSLYSLTNIPMSSPAGRLIASHADRLWQAYYELPSIHDARNLLSLIKDVSSVAGLDKDAVANFVLGLSRTLSARCAGADDSFLEIEALALGVVALLPLAGDAGSIDHTVKILSTELVGKTNAFLLAIYQELQSDPHYLLTGHPADFFYLPVRIMRLLGWIGACVLLSEFTGCPSAVDILKLQELTVKITDTYSASLTAMTDSQAPFLLSFLVGASKSGWREECELVVGCIFRSLVEVKGKVASARLTPNQAFDYLFRRMELDFSEQHSLLAQPTEILPIILLMGSRLAMADVIDPFLEKIDHLRFNVFIPNSYNQFDEPVIHNGRNHIFEIGNGVWKVDDFNLKWDAECTSHFVGNKILDCPSTQIGSLLASLLFPDRVPWFIAAANG